MGVANPKGLIVNMLAFFYNRQLKVVLIKKRIGVAEAFFYNRQLKVVLIKKRT